MSFEKSNIFLVGFHCDLFDVSKYNDNTCQTNIYIVYVIDPRNFPILLFWIHFCEILDTTVVDVGDDNKTMSMGIRYDGRAVENLRPRVHLCTQELGRHYKHLL